MAWIKKKHTESVRILHPIGPPRRIQRGSINIDIAKLQIRSVHDVQAPQRRLPDEESVHDDLTDVPKDKGHRTAWLRVSGLSSVPGVAVAVDATGAMAVDPDVVSRDDEAGPVVLEGDGVGMVAPVVEIFGKLLSPSAVQLRHQLHTHRRGG